MKYIPSSGSVAVVLLIAVAVFSLFNLVSSYNTGLVVREKISLFAEESRPADISVTRILYRDCERCAGTENVMKKLSSLNVKINGNKTLYYGSQEAGRLIEKYGIEYLPALVITGETEKESISSSLRSLGERKSDGSVVYSGGFPHYDIGVGKVVGLVNATLIRDASCDACIDMSSVAGMIARAGAEIYRTETLDYPSPEAEKLFDEYGIERVPALVISGEVSHYPDAMDIITRLGGIERGGFYVINAVQPPYIETASGSVAGLVELVNIVDRTCEDCYNVSMHLDILRNMGLYIDSAKTFDVSSPEGKEIIRKYNITRVPTIVLSPEAGRYALFSSVWNQVGTVEADGWRVFRNMEALAGAKYRTLTSGGKE